MVTRNAPCQSSSLSTARCVTWMIQEENVQHPVNYHRGIWALYTETKEGELSHYITATFNPKKPIIDRVGVNRLVQLSVTTGAGNLYKILMIWTCCSSHCSCLCQHCVVVYVPENVAPREVISNNISLPGDEESADTRWRRLCIIYSP